MATDYYAVLGVERGASDADIKRAYRGLARRFHPDVADDKTAAEEHFKEINQAYEVLSDPQKRQMYDRFGSVDGAPGGAGGFSGAEGFGDIFDMFFGARPQSAGRQTGPVRGADLRYDLQITLEEAFTGTDREIAFDLLAECETCHGAGAKPGTLVVPCDRCGGSGTMRTTRQTPLGSFVAQTTCNKCGGEGQIVQTPCETCRGRGRVARSRALTVRIPAGVDDGSRIRLAQSGEAGSRGGPPGDLIVFLSVAPHPRFARQGLDLFVDVPIAFTTAALGGALQIDALEGPLELAVAAGTQSGAQYRLRGRGMPAVRGGTRGDLVATMHVVVPTRLSRREREILEEFAKIGGDRIEERSFMDKVKDAFRAE